MNQDFIDAWKEVRKDFPTEWLSWLGFPNLYDCGLCVNRTPEEVVETSKYRYKVKL